MIDTSKRANQRIFFQLCEQISLIVLGSTTLWSKIRDEIRNQAYNSSISRKLKSTLIRLQQRGVLKEIILTLEDLSDK